MTLKVSTRAIVVLILFVTFLIYFWYQFQGLLFGSELLVYSPQNGESFDTGEVVVRGIVKDISSLQVNGRPIYVDGEGYFEESLLFNYGLHSIEVKAKDTFGEILKERRMIFIK